MDELKRLQNEREFEFWIVLPGGGRKYWFDITGRKGGKATYIKEVDVNEMTTAFYQEIYNAEAVLIEIHKKFPTDEGHQKIS